ncbi:MAG: toll/interleukin-1 receptor domain-containing protein [Bacteroidetes bacterium]|nr:toll/interleukin-1 receptor domain-containing protein [Bacteroidota bacterium]
MRDSIFISHANPENNYFAAWLASKLRLLGYKVWVDVSDIKPGQYFNRDFEKIIKEDAVRFLAVVSNDYIIKSKRDDTGVMNEILCARTIKEIDGFIIPLHYDSSDFGEFTVGLRGRLAIPFNENWADGLHELVQYLEEANIPRTEHQNNTIQFWHEAQKIKSEPIEKEEKYLTNWFPAILPEHIYIHQPEVLIEREFVLMPFSYIREGDRLISFVSIETIQGFTRISSSHKLPVTDLFNNDTIQVDEKFQLIEPNKKLVKLMNKIFRSNLVRKKMRIYEQANRREIFHFPYSPENKKQVSLKQIGKTRRTVIGVTSEFTWYFAISHAASTFPYSNFKIFYHLVFADNNGKHLKSDDQHELRRSLPSDWFNRKWLETLLAMMLKISNFDMDNQIKIEVDSNVFLTVNVLPIEIISSIGYKEPTNEIEPAILP